MIEQREPVTTVGFIDEYCQAYRGLFGDIRNFEVFKFLHVGMLSELQSKTLPAIAKLVGLKDGQSLHHFLRDGVWKVEQIRIARLRLIQHTIGQRRIVLCIDETGDVKKGKTTEYVAKQYIGNIGQTANGIVSVNAYAVVDKLTYPLLFKIFKPKSRLQADDEYKTKPQLAIEILQEVKALGFQVELVLADSLYGESGDVIRTIEHLGWSYIVAIRSNHGVLVGPGQRVRYNRWRAYDQPLVGHPAQRRHIREIIFGQRRSTRYFQITKGATENPDKADSWFIMTDLPGDILRLPGLYTLRTWIEYGFKQVKDELGWADFRLTAYSSIERWWEVVFSAYLLVTLHVERFKLVDAVSESVGSTRTTPSFTAHLRWERGTTWKSALNNLRLLLQTYVSWGAIKRWLEIFSIPGLKRGLFKLMDKMNQFSILPHLQAQAA